MSSCVSVRPRYARWNLPQHLCLCAEIPRVQTRTRFLRLQHLMELGKKSNPERVAALALVNSRPLVYGSLAESLDTALLAEPGLLRLRDPTHPSGMSTLDAIARAVAVLKGPEVAAPLELLAALRVQWIAKCGTSGRSQSMSSRAQGAQARDGCWHT